MKRIPSVAPGRHLFVIAGLALASTVGNLLAAVTDTYYVSDHLATTTAVADAAGEIASLEADAFGSPVSGGEQAARYTGKPYDADIGAYVFPFRNYRSEEARWMSADPSGFPDGNNGRIYAVNPLVGYDALGLSGKSLLYVYFYANGGGISAASDASLNSDIYNNWNYLLEDMAYEDNRLFSDTHYLDDGDSLTYAVVTSLAGANTLFGAGGYTSIYIIAHGNTSGSTQQRILDGVWYNDSIVRGWSSSISELVGCTIVGGSITANTALASLEAKARAYLRE